MAAAAFVARGSFSLPLGTSLFDLPGSVCGRALRTRLSHYTDATPGTGPRAPLRTKFLGRAALRLASRAAAQEAAQVSVPEAAQATAADGPTATPPDLWPRPRPVPSGSCRTGGGPSRGGSCGRPTRPGRSACAGERGGVASAMPHRRSLSPFDALTQRRQPKGGQRPQPTPLRDREAI